MGGVGHWQAPFGNVVFAQVSPDLHAFDDDWMHPFTAAQVTTWFPGRVAIGARARLTGRHRRAGASAAGRRTACGDGQARRVRHHQAAVDHSAGDGAGAVRRAGISRARGTRGGHRRAGASGVREVPCRSSVRRRARAERGQAPIGVQAAFFELAAAAKRPRAGALGRWRRGTSHTSPRRPTGAGLRARRRAGDGETTGGIDGAGDDRLAVAGIAERTSLGAGGRLGGTLAGGGSETRRRTVRRRGRTWSRSRRCSRWCRRRTSPACR